MLIGTDLYYIINGICLLFIIPSTIYFWKYIIENEKKEDEEIKKRWDNCE